LRSRYGDLLVQRDAAAAGEQRKDLENLVDGAEALPPPAASVYIDLPPTEWEDYWTRVDLMFDDDGHVRRYWLSLGWGAHPEAKSKMFDHLVAKLGEPKRSEDALGDESFVFPSERHVELKSDPLTKGWTIAVSASAPAGAGAAAPPDSADSAAPADPVGADPAPG
jgi:hypothetical protein